LTRLCLGDTANQAKSKGNALTQITQLLHKPPSEWQDRKLKAKVRSLESLYFDIQAALPWAAFETMLTANVTQLAYFPPVPRKMQDALNESLRAEPGYRQRRGAERIYVRHKAKQGADNRFEVFETTTLPPLLTDSSQQRSMK
jgi:hypothetical protein